VLAGDDGEQARVAGVDLDAQPVGDAGHGNGPVRADMAERPRVTIEIVPAEVGVHVGLLGAFAYAGFEDDTPGIVYMESPDQGQTTKHPATVAKIALTYDTIRTEALGGRASRDLIRKVAEERWS
jgi:hypothetical protein